MEKRRFKWIRDNILIKFIRACREHYSAWRRGAPIGDDEVVNSWGDGDNSQVPTITNDEGIAIYAANRVTANKHGASATGVQQANDRMKVFMMSKRLNKKTIVKHL